MPNSETGQGEEAGLCATGLSLPKEEGSLRNRFPSLLRDRYLSAQQASLSYLRVYIARYVSLRGERGVYSLVCLPEG